MTYTFNLAPRAATMAAAALRYIGLPFDLQPTSDPGIYTLTTPDHPPLLSLPFLAAGFTGRK